MQPAARSARLDWIISRAPGTHSRRNVSTKMPRASRCTVGVTWNTPAIVVLSRISAIGNGLLQLRP